jgi:hypothetical protein
LTEKGRECPLEKQWLQWSVIAKVVKFNQPHHIESVPTAGIFVARIALASPTTPLILAAGQAIEFMHIVTIRGFP